jgi:4-amino-4-deoxy-L-arabinose transferase-like glycosyltransferase
MFLIDQQCLYSKKMNKLTILFKNSQFVIVLLIVVGALLRLYNLNWDQGHYLHPDERLYVNASNISFPKSIAEFFSPESPLNPKMFYYGSFPLYIYKIINVSLIPSINFVLASRLISSLFSIFTLPLIFLICRQLFTKRVSIFATFIFTFAAGIIQHAHFNTTESILTFLLTFITLLSIRLSKKNTYTLALTLGIFVGISYATKIVGLTFALIPFTSFVILFLKKTEIQKIIISILIFLFATAIAGFLFAPYQIIDYQQFSSEQDYMQGVTYGKDRPPFVIIYEDTIPYFYQITKIFPFTFGFISLPLSLFGLYFIARKSLKEKSSCYIYIFILLYPILYFLWSGAWYVKFSRYYILLIPFLSIWAAYFLSKLNYFFVKVLLLLIAINGLVFMQIYLQPNTRVQASEWIYANIPNQSKITGEHWDDNLPLLAKNNYDKQYAMSQLTVYDIDSIDKIAKLSQTLSQNDYFIISSRRVYYSILKNKDKYPLTCNFYKLLFEEKLGFELVKKFTNYPFYFSDDFADETFQSYDHPPVYIFKNMGKFSSDRIRKLLLLPNRCLIRE